MFIDVIVGEDPKDEQSKQMVMQSIQMLCAMYPDNPEYADTLVKAYEKFIF